MDHQIKGFEITGDAVLQDQFLPLEDGLTVVYGLNGAGKSRLLKGIRKALLGEGSDIGVFLVVQTKPDAWESDEYPFRHHKFKSATAPPTLRYAIAEMIAGATPELSFRNLEFESVDSLSPKQVEDAINEVFEYRLKSTDSDLEKEIFNGQFFLLRPLGISNGPRWEAWPAYDSARPAAKAHLAIYEKLVAEDNGDARVSDATEHLDLGPIVPPSDSFIFIASGGKRFKPTRFIPFDADELESPLTLGSIMLTPSTPVLDFGLDLIDASSDANIASTELLGSIAMHTARLSMDELARAASPHVLEAHGMPPEQHTRIARVINSYLTEDSVRFYETSGTKPGVEIPVRHFSAQITERVQEYFQSVMGDSPAPTLHLTAPEDRFTRPAAVWEFHTEYPGEPHDWAGPSLPLELGDMSSAEQTWLQLAIADALYWTKREIEHGEVLRSALTIIDEPEAALHRSAESRMAHALIELAMSDPRRIILVATHSPELLDHPRANLIEVKRNTGQLSRDDHAYGAKHPRSTVQPLELNDRDSLHALGLNPSDLLRWTKIFLLVEGHHEQIILEKLFLPRLQKARVEIIPLEGAKNLSKTVDSYALFKFTRAHVVGLVDNLQHQAVQESWDKARELRSTTSEQAAVDHINRTLNSPSGKRGSQDEVGFIRSWLVKALESELDSRLSPHALAQKDILDYLPVKSFVPTATSWNELWEQFAEARKTRPEKTPKQFKKWLAGRGNSKPLNDDTILEAVTALTSVPQEFEQLMKRLEAISSEL